MQTELEKQRAKFEMWWLKNMNIRQMDLMPRYGGGYVCEETNRCWITWQAAQNFKLPCQHEFHYFGEQKTRRCVNCNALEKIENVRFISNEPNVCSKGGIKDENNLRDK